MKFQVSFCVHVYVCFSLSLLVRARAFVCECVCFPVNLCSGGVLISSCIVVDLHTVDFLYKELGCKKNNNKQTNKKTLKRSKNVPCHRSSLHD